MIGGVSLFLRDVVRIYVLFFFFLCSYIILLYTGLVAIRHTLYLSFDIYMMMYVYSPISPCVVSFLTWYTCFFMYAIFYFYFTLRCLDEFCLKCYRKTGCQDLSCHELSFCKDFQKFMLGLDFIVFNKWLWV